MSEAAGPERVTSAEQIEVSVREAQSAVVPGDAVPGGAVPRDTGRWAAKVDRLAVEQRDGVRGTNVAGRRLTGPVQGFGKMWQKTYRMTVGDTVTPQDAISTWKANFPELWPKGNRFAGALTGISPGDVALLDLAIGGGVKLSTGVFVLYADDESFTLMTPQGHMFAGWITFSAERTSAATAVQAQVLMRANDPLYEVAMTFGGHGKEDKFWAQTLTALGDKLGVPVAEVQTRTVCVDSKRQWRNARNIWHNSMVRSVLQTVAAPFTARRRRAQRAERPGRRGDAERRRAAGTCHRGGGHARRRVPDRGTDPPGLPARRVRLQPSAGPGLTVLPAVRPRGARGPVRPSGGGVRASARRWPGRRGDPLGAADRGAPGP